MIQGDSYEDVVSQIKDYRLNNGKPIGSPSMDVLRYYQRVCPWMVIDDLKPALESPISEIYGQWRAWISDMWKNPVSAGLSRKEASFRWDKCLTCPHNVPKEWPASLESAEMHKRAYLLGQGMNIDDGIGFCNLHKLDIGVASLFEKPKQSSRKDEAAEQPAECWVI